MGQHRWFGLKESIDVPVPRQHFLRSALVACAVFVPLDGTLASPVWPQQQFLPFSDSDPGTSLIAHGDGFIVGRPRISNGVGAIQFIDRVGEQHELGQLINEPAAGPGALFGQVVASAGDLLAVGEPRLEVVGGPIPGGVKIFRRAGDVWTYSATVGNELGANVGDSFGQSLAVAGEQIAVGVPGLLSQRGAIHLFNEVEGVWRDGGLLVGFDTTNFSYLGRSLAATADTIVAGAPGWTEVPSGNSPGAAYVFTRHADGFWFQSARLASSRPVHLGQYGASVSIQGDYLVVGAPSEFVDGVKAGVAYVYRRSVDGWIEEGRLSASDLRVFDEAFGNYVDIVGSTICVSAPLKDNEFGANAGAVYVFERIEQSWTETGRLTPTFETVFGNCAIGAHAIATVGFDGMSRGIRFFPSAEQMLRDSFE